MSRYDELKYRLFRLSREFPDIFGFKVLGSVVHGHKEYDILRLKIHKGSEKNKVKVCLAFGTHGSEDLTFQSVDEFLKSILNPHYKHPFMELPSAHVRGMLLDNLSLTFYFFNPVGFARSERTNGNRLDLNRWFGKDKAPHEVAVVMEDMKHHHFDACIDLHGDAGGKRFMIYERSRIPDSIAKKIINVLKENKVAIVSDGNHEGDIVQHGVIASPPFAHTFDDYLFFEKNVAVSLVFEYPGKGEVVEDIKSLMIALYAALELFSKEVIPRSISPHS